MLSTSGRGCGSMVYDGLYATSPISPNGTMPVKNLTVCPQIVVDPQELGISPRGVTLLPEFDHEGKPTGYANIWDLIGSQYYPYKVKFYEEVRRKGFSRRLPRNLPTQDLDIDQSSYYCLHARGALDPQWVRALTRYVDPEQAVKCLRNVGDHQKPFGEEFDDPCTAYWWHELSESDCFREVGGWIYKHNSFDFKVWPQAIDFTWKPAIFMLVPLRYIQFACTLPRGKGELSPELAKKAEELTKKGLNVNVLDLGYEGVENE
jgi:hypothetical protein